MKVKAFDSTLSINEFLSKNHQNGDLVLKENGSLFEIIRKKEVFHWLEVTHLDMKGLIKKINLINPKLFKDSEIQNHEQLFAAINKNFFKAGFKNNNFIELNILFPIAGVLIIYFLQFLTEFIFSNKTLNNVLVFGTPVILLLIRAQLGSKRLKEKHISSNLKSKLFSIIHQILFALGLVALMIFECTSSLISQEINFLYVAILSFASYITLMYMSDLSYEKHLTK